MNEIWGGVVTIAVAIIGVATLAVIVSKNSQTANVLHAAGSAFGGSLSAALSPVSGNMGMSVPSYSMYGAG